MNLKTPGVYINEVNAFPNSVTAVATAVPIFIGYTKTAAYNGKLLIYKPTLINSFADYTTMFGAGFKAKFEVKIDKASVNVQIKADNTAYLYNSIRLFFANGGGPCYILSVGTYDTKNSLKISAADFIGTNNVFDILKKEQEPTIIVIPDAIALGTDAYTEIYQAALMHCGDMQSRIALFDLVNEAAPDKRATVVDDFRTAIGNNFLNYGTAYYPWLKTAIVQPDEVDFENIDDSIKLETILHEQNIKALIDNYHAIKDPSVSDKQTFHNALKVASPAYVYVLDQISQQLNLLPPSGAMAGIYTMVDNSRGVWKAPANISVNMVNAPSVNLTDTEQATMNVDPVTGKSINVIRAFPGIGTLVWGARTLDGNSQDWHYINVRRTVIMIEQSLKLAAKAFVFEPNVANTWVTVKSMFDNFLTNLWKQGALAGSKPEDAFWVQIGLGSTMTPDDILNNVMNVSAMVAIVRPAEFIVISFSQQMQQS